MAAPSSLHLDLDGAWPRDVLPDAGYFDAQHWGAKLRYWTNARLVERFFSEVEPQLADFTLYGSGDFHHVSALLLRRVKQPFTLVSFDNHPDWDIRPPHWGCGTWLNRALELPQMRQAVIWGCSNGELNWPGRLFANHTARRARRLHAHPWAERTVPSSQKIWPSVTRMNWREKFSRVMSHLASGFAYVTVDIDCLAEGEATTNWESGLFMAEEIAWALRELRKHVTILGGDICGAYSPIRYARWFQSLAGTFDHPKPVPVDANEALKINRRAFEIIWPALVGGDERNASADQHNSDVNAC